MYAGVLKTFSHFVWYNHADSVAASFVVYVYTHEPATQQDTGWQLWKPQDLHFTSILR